MKIAKPTSTIPVNTLNKRMEPYQKIAKGMEKQFSNFLINEMRKTVIQTNPDQHEMKFYRSLLDSEYADVMSSKGKGLGIQDLILKQILPQDLLKFYNNNGNNNINNIKNNLKKFQQQSSPPQKIITNKGSNS